MRPAFILAAFFLVLYLAQPAFADCLKGGASPANTILMYISGALLAISLPIYYVTKFMRNVVYRKRAKLVARGALLFFGLTMIFWQLDKNMKEANALQGCGTEYPLPATEAK